MVLYRWRCWLSRLAWDLDSLEDATMEIMQWEMKYKKIMTTKQWPNIKSKVATFDIILLNHFDSFLVQVTLSVNMIVQT